MTAADIVRIVSTVGVVQLFCNLVSNWSVFHQEPYRRALESLARQSLKVNKERQQQQTAEVAAPTTKSIKNKKQSKNDKRANKIKRAEDDYAAAVAEVSGLHVIPNIMTGLIFLVLMRILGTDLSGQVVGVLPFVPFKYLHVITGRGLAFETAAALESSDDMLSTKQACGFLFVYFLCNFTVKFYINKLVGTNPPVAAEGGMMSLLDSPANKKMLKVFGLEPDDY
jgi:uncharacterized membrane protein (DUF106 family)